MKAFLTVVAYGKTETLYSITVETPLLPRVGEYISVLRKHLDGVSEDDLGTEDFLVKRVWWHYDYVDAGHGAHAVGEEPVGTCAGVSITCEMAVSELSSEAHRRAAGSRAKRIG